MAFIVTVLIVPQVRAFCLAKGYVDMPNARKIHKEPIPRLGGVAIWLGTMISFFILVMFTKYPYGNGLSGILTGGSIIFLLGFVDDIYDLPPKFKLFVQIGAALIAILLGVRIDELWNPFGSAIQLGILAVPITLFWIVGLSNAMNFIDGVDGLAGTVSAIGAVALAVLAVSTVHPQPIAALLSVILAGSMIGFLLFNFNPAKIFMGDSGALFTGFTLASLSVVGLMKTVTFSVFLPIFIFAVPILDITYAVFRRLLKGKNPFKADSEHIHHKLIHLGVSHNNTVFVFVITAVSAGAIAAIFVNSQNLYFSVIASLLIFMAVVLRISNFFSGADKAHEHENEFEHEHQQKDAVESNK